MPRRRIREPIDQNVSIMLSATMRDRIEAAANVQGVSVGQIIRRELVPTFGQANPMPAPRKAT